MNACGCPVGEYIHAKAHPPSRHPFGCCSAHPLWAQVRVQRKLALAKASESQNMSMRSFRGQKGVEDDQGGSMRDGRGNSSRSVLSGSSFRGGKGKENGSGLGKEDVANIHRQKYKDRNGGVANGAEGVGGEDLDEPTDSLSANISSLLEFIHWFCEGFFLKVRRGRKGASA